jgi:16S rRNA (uracil1498-N3)-methyltransferase
VTRERRTARGHAFVDDVARPELDDDDRHHLERVLRLRAGDEITVSDGCGGWRRCRFGPALEPAGPVRVEPRPAPAITVAVALTKGDRPEWAVQKLTEVGVDRVVLLAAARSVVRWDDGRATRNVERLQRVAREAAMQSRRVWLPEVCGVVPFAQVAALPGATLADPDGDPPSLDRPTVLIGPEGGFDEEELAVGLPTTALGPGVLRAETAAVVAGAFLAGLRTRLLVTPRGGV